MRFNKVTIIGVGLIGGSMGLAIKKKKIARQIVGVCRHKSSINRAKRLGAIDKGSLDCKSAVKGAELVILASPIRQILKIAKRVCPYLKKGVILTDVGSTKEELVRRIEKIVPEGCYFVGAHPLAGSERRGVSFARADLFKGAICILTRSKRTKSSALGRVAWVWKKLGSQVKVLSPAGHDRIVALISHLPHLAAVQLVRVASANLPFAGSGFSDTTRIASSEAEIWTDIFLTNKKFVIRALDSYIKQLQLTRDLIRKEDKARLSAEFRKAKILRDGLQKN